MAMTPEKQKKKNNTNSTQHNHPPNNIPTANSQRDREFESVNIWATFTHNVFDMD